ncbi:MAG: hypothetical protein N2C12_04140, partial [Planctomycetales bacterium]
MVFTLVFLSNLCRLMLDGAPLFLGLGVIIAARLELEGLVAGDAVGRTLFLLFLPGTLIAIVVQ